MIDFNLGIIVGISILLTGAPIGFIDGHEYSNCIPKTIYQEYSLWRYGCDVAVYLNSESSYMRKYREQREKACRAAMEKFKKEFPKDPATFNIGGPCF